MPVVCTRNKTKVRTGKLENRTVPDKIIKINVTLFFIKNTGTTSRIQLLLFAGDFLRAPIYFGARIFLLHKYEPIFPGRTIRGGARTFDTKPPRHAFLLYPNPVRYLHHKDRFISKFINMVWIHAIYKSKCPVRIFSQRRTV